MAEMGQRGASLEGGDRRRCHIVRHAVRLEMLNLEV